MTAAVISKFNDQLEIQDLPVPEVSANDVLVKIQACGVCYTDLHACHGDWPVKPLLPQFLDMKVSVKLWYWAMRLNI